MVECVANNILLLHLACCVFFKAVPFQLFHLQSILILCVSNLYHMCFCPQSVAVSLPAVSFQQKKIWKGAVSEPSNWREPPNFGAVLNTPDDMNIL